MSTLDTIKEIFIFLYGVEITENTAITDEIGLDSLSLFELLREVEYRFDIDEISSEQYANLNTVSDLVVLVDKLK